MPLAGCTPAELAAQAAPLLQRDREEIVRLAYVAATRARDLLVVPVIGEEPVEGWLDAARPRRLPRARRAPRSRAPAPGCPPFGKETVLDRPGDALAAMPVAPGLHTPQKGPHEVVFWGAPKKEELEREVEPGLRSMDILVEDAASKPAAEAHARWRDQRRRAVEEGAQPSLQVETATARSMAAPGGEGVALEEVAAREPERPRGKRFGTLVHAVLAEVDLKAGAEAVARAAAAQGRIAGAPAEEVAAAARAVLAALQHPLLLRAARSEECRREEPLVHRLADGTLLEGVVDLAFRDPGGWTVVDFKTDARPADHAHYAAQLRLYCAAVEAATGLPARAALLAV